MKFEQETAEKIAKEHNVPDATIKVWKTRGAIPDKYLRANYSKVEVLSIEDEKLQNKIMKILNLSELRMSQFVYFVSHPTKLSDLKAKKTNLTVSEIKAIFGLVSEIKAEILGIMRDDRRFLDSYEKRVLSFLTRPEIVVNVLLKSTVSNITAAEYNQIKNKIQKKIDYPLSVMLIDKIVEALKRLYVQMQ